MKSKTTKFLALAALILGLILFFGGREIISWRPQKTGLPGLPTAFSSGGEWMVVENDGFLLRNLATGRTLAPNGPKDTPVFAPDGRSFAFCTNPLPGKNGIAWHELPSGRLLKQFVVEDFDVVNEIPFQFSPDGTKILIRRPDGVEIAPLKGGKTTQIFLTQNAGASFLSSNGQKWAATFGPYSSAHTVAICDLSTRRVLCRFQPRHACVSRLLFSPAATLCAVTTTDGPGGDIGFAMVDAQTGRTLWKLLLDADFAFAPGEENLWMLLQNADTGRAELVLHEGKTGRVLRTVVVGTRPATYLSCFVLAPDGLNAWVSDGGEVWKVRLR